MDRPLERVSIALDDGPESIGDWGEQKLSLINLHLITGRIGKPGNGPFSLTGQPNAMGGRETGGLANVLPAHRDVTNAAHRAEVEAFWNSPVKIASKPGLTATEMFDALADGTLKAIWIINTNPLVSMPDVNAAEKALKNARFVVVQDVSNRADTVQFADVVLPAAAWLEKEGTMTNAERRIAYLPKVLDAPGEALPDVEIIWRFAQKMGFGDDFNYTNASEVYQEYTRITAGTNVDVTGVSYDLLKKNVPFSGLFQRRKGRRKRGRKGKRARSGYSLIISFIHRISERRFMPYPMKIRQSQPMRTFRLY